MKIEKIYSISQVAEEIDVSPGTIRHWEKEMDGLIIVRRDEQNNRYYTREDIEQYLKINKLREEGFSLSNIKKIFEMMSSGNQTYEEGAGQLTYTSPTDPKNLPAEIKTVNQLTESFQHLLQHIGELNKKIDDLVASNQEVEVLKKLDEYQSQLPKNIDHVAERQRRITDHITQKRVEDKLEQEALSLWFQKPLSERIKKVGWFRKEEDLYARDQFIKQYINKHYEERLKQEYGITE